MWCMHIINGFGAWKGACCNTPHITEHQHSLMTWGVINSSPVKNKKNQKKQLSSNINAPRENMRWNLQRERETQTPLKSVCDNTWGPITSQVTTSERRNNQPFYLHFLVLLILPLTRSLITLFIWLILITYLGMKRFEKLTASLLSPLWPRRKTPQDLRALSHAVWSPDGVYVPLWKDTIIQENNTHKMSFKEEQVEKIWTMGFA